MSLMSGKTPEPGTCGVCGTSLINDDPDTIRTDTPFGPIDADCGAMWDEYNN